MSSQNPKHAQKRTYRLQARAERQEETRRRIAAATAELHEEVGPARTTIAEIARRAGVQRPTVYNNFPHERDLLAACQAHYLAQHPRPDPGSALALVDPAERLRGTLVSLYAYFRATQGMSRNVQRDRRLVPELDSLLAEGWDAQIGGLAQALAHGFESTGRSRARVLATVRLAVEFFTWDRLAGEGLSDAEAADVMVGAVRAAAGQATASPRRARTR